MDKMHGRVAQESTLSPGTQQKLAFGVAGAVAVVAIVLAIIITMRVPQYEAQARLAYNPAAVSQADSSSLIIPFGSAQASHSGPATATASKALVDAQLTHIIDQFDLYPELRQRQSTVALTGVLRDRLSLTEPEAGILQIAFRDADQAKATAVTNGIASVLANYQVMTNIAAPVDPASQARRQTRAVTKNYPRSVPVPATAASVPQPLRPTSGYDTAYYAELSRQVDRVDSALHDLQDAHGELEAEQRQVAGKIEALERTEHRAAEARSGNRSEAARSERSVAEQDLAVEKAKLASLRERYTDAYPDVQATEDDIAKLQAKLAGLPAASTGTEKVTPTAEQADAMEKLRQEKQRIERDLVQNQASVEAETQRRTSLIAQMQQVKGKRLFQPQPQPSAPVATATLPVPDLQPSRDLLRGADTLAPQAASIQVPVFPFSVVQRAGSAGLITTSRLTLGLWLGLATALLIALCFVPLVPAHYAAVVTTAEDLKNAMPEHVSYLGDVGRTEP